jgi:hypothetical protein
MKLPLWRLATFLLLSVALAISVANGRTIDAVIIGALLALTLVALGIWIYLWSTGYWRRIAQRHGANVLQDDIHEALRTEIEAELGPQLALSDVDLGRRRLARRCRRGCHRSLALVRHNPKAS